MSVALANQAVSCDAHDLDVVAERRCSEPAWRGAQAEAARRGVTGSRHDVRGNAVKDIASGVHGMILLHATSEV